jgi:thioredoxin reductase
MRNETTDVLVMGGAPAERPGRRRARALRYGDGDGATLTAQRLLVATGLSDELPDVPGLRERWGREAVAYPYYHGWDVERATVRKPSGV